MTDLLMLLTIAAFFALCIAYVWWCDRIIGPDPVEVESVSPDERSNAEAVSR